MTDLSPTAQAVLDAMYEVNLDIEEENANLAVAVLRTAVAEVLPTTWEKIYVGGGRFEEYETVNPAATALLAIANELEGMSN
jgi:hypothetical protein